MPDPIPPANISRCSGCATKRYSSGPVVPVFETCGTPFWPTLGSNLPYFNSGNNTTGFVQDAGVDSLTSDGTNLNTLDIPFAGYDSFVTIPPVIDPTGDFSASLELLIPNGYNTLDIWWNIMDKLKRAGASFGWQGNAGSSYKNSVYGSSCDYIYGTPTGDPPVNIDGPAMNLGEWNTLELTRTGTIYAININGSSVLSKDFGVTFGHLMRLQWSTNYTPLSIRNIMVNQS